MAPPQLERAVSTVPSRFVAQPSNAAPSPPVSPKLLRGQSSDAKFWVRGETIGRGSLGEVPAAGPLSAASLERRKGVRVCPELLSKPLCLNFSKCDRVAGSRF